MAQYMTTGTAIVLDVELIRKVRDNRYELPFKRLEAACKLIDDIEKQLSADLRKLLEPDDV